MAPVRLISLGKQFTLKIDWEKIDWEDKGLINLPHVMGYYFGAKTDKMSIAKTYEDENTMIVTLRIPKSDYKNKSFQNLLKCPELPVQDEYYYRDWAVHMVMVGENEKTVLFSHGRVTLDVKDNAKADYVIVEVVIKQKEDMLRGVVFGLELEETYKEAWGKVMNPVGLNVVVPVVAVSSGVVLTGIKNAKEITEDEDQEKDTGVDFYNSDESTIEFAVFNNDYVDKNAKILVYRSGSSSIYDIYDGYAHSKDNIDIYMRTSTPNVIAQTDLSTPTLTSPIKLTKTMTTLQLFMDMLFNTTAYVRSYSEDYISGGMVYIIVRPMVTKTLVLGVEKKETFKYEQGDIYTFDLSSESADYNIVIGGKIPVKLSLAKSSTILRESMNLTIDNNAKKIRATLEKGTYLLIIKNTTKNLTDEYNISLKLNQDLFLNGVGTWIETCADGSTFVDIKRPIKIERIRKVTYLSKQQTQDLYNKLNNDEALYWYSMAATGVYVLIWVGISYNNWPSLPASISDWPAKLKVAVEYGYALFKNGVGWFVGTMFKPQYKTNLLKVLSNAANGNMLNGNKFSANNGIKVITVTSLQPPNNVSTYFIPWTDGTMRGRTGCFGKFDTNDLFVNIYSSQNLYLKDDTSI